MANIENTNNSTQKLFLGIEKLINHTKQQVAIYVNNTLNNLNWSIGNYIISEIKYEIYSDYGKKILATLSQELTKSFGKGYSYSALTRMIKVASEYDSEMFATLSQTLTWSHFVELVTIKDKTKRLFYHRKLNRLIAIDLKLGKFKPKHKAQMELYLRYLQKYDQQPNENTPIGLLLCSEGNTEHIELLLLGDENIKVAQYLTQLPDKQWFADKLQKSIEIAKESQIKTEE